MKKISVIALLAVLLAATGCSSSKYTPGTYTGEGEGRRENATAN